MKVCIHTFGCQMNKLDSELIAEALVATGHEITANEDEAKVILFNTCSVRDHAEQRVFSRISHLKHRKKAEPDLIIGIMGCFAQRKGERLREKLPHLDLICGTRKFPIISELLEQAMSGPVTAIEEVPLTAPGTLDAHGRCLHEGIQAYISVMRGCNNFCTYCIVPYVRGREESRPVSSIVDEVKILADKGVKEITLLGQNVDAYGKDIDSSLAELLREVHKVEEITRFRFVTSHPRDVNEELLAAVAELPRVCDHLHMPAQSGSTRILKAMNRGYTREEYDRKLEIVSRIVPGALVTCDIIVGFPGEAEDDFNLTAELLEKARFQNSYIFKYSPRPGTAAEKLPDDVEEEEKKRRNQVLLEIQERVKQERASSLVGTTQEILVEGISSRNTERMSGRTQNNMICVFDTPDNPQKLIGELLRLEIYDCTPLTLFGRPV